MKITIEQKVKIYREITSMVKVFDVVFDLTNDEREEAIRATIDSIVEIVETK